MSLYKIVSVASDSTPKYLYYLPLVKWTWQQFGWDTFTTYVGYETKISSFVESVIDSINGFDWYIRSEKYPSATISQVSRMYASSQFTYEHIMMLSDSDMIPLSDYWKPDENKITCWGRNLSDEHQPMCFVAMNKKLWSEVMDYDKLFLWGDLEQWYPRASNKWTVDQNIITDKIRSHHRVEISREIDKRTGYPAGRVDRSNWHMNHSQLIDAHLPHDILTNEESFHKVLNLLHHVWPTQDFKWFINYHKEFKKLL